MTLVDRAAERLGRDPRDALTVWSPGRVNLIGDHIDYSGGLVLPMALDRGTRAVIVPRADQVVRGFSADLPGVGIVAADLADTALNPVHDWFSYPLGVVALLQDSGVPLAHGFDLYVEGSIPAGSGLSSSASLELAVATGLAAVFDIGWDPTQWAVLCRRVENEYIGVSSGIMDQLAIARGVAGAALLMDCAELTVTPVPMPLDRCTVLVANTMAPRTLAGSAYNERRAAVATAAQVLGVDAAVLAQVDAGTVTAAESELRAAGVWAEARHTVTEQARVIAAAAALNAGDVTAVGRLMRESHESLRDDFRVTGSALDALAEAAWDTPGVLGARMTGAGFGGCVVVLAEPTAAEVAGVEIARRYSAGTGVTPEVFPVAPGAGAHVVRESRRA